MDSRFATGVAPWTMRFAHRPSAFAHRATPLPTGSGAPDIIMRKGFFIENGGNRA